MLSLGGYGLPTGGRLVAGALVVLALPGVSPTQPVDAPISVPSGQEVLFLDVVTDEKGPAGLTYRFRFVAPGISRDSGAVEFEQAVLDMDHLCREYALERLSEIGPRPSQIVISLSDREIEFGVVDPSVTQFFEAYRPENGDCIWEGF